MAYYQLLICAYHITLLWNYDLISGMSRWCCHTQKWNPRPNDRHWDKNTLQWLLSTHLSTQVGENVYQYIAVNFHMTECELDDLKVEYIYETVINTIKHFYDIMEILPPKTSLMLKVFTQLHSCFCHNTIKSTDL